MNVTVLLPKGFNYCVNILQTRLMSVWQNIVLGNIFLRCLMTVRIIFAGELNYWSIAGIIGSKGPSHASFNYTYFPKSFKSRPNELPACRPIGYSLVAYPGKVLAYNGPATSVPDISDHQAPGFQVPGALKSSTTDPFFTSSCSHLRDETHWMSQWPPFSNKIRHTRLRALANWFEFCKRS